MNIFENINTVLNIVALLGLVIWLPVFLLFYLYNFFRLREKQAERYIARDRAEFEYERMRRERHYEKDNTDIDSYLPKLMEEIPYKTAQLLGARFVDQINSALDDNLKNIFKDLSDLVQHSETKDQSSISDNRQLIREIAHSLNTPLSQIEASAEILSTDCGDEEKKQTIESIIISVNICKSFIAAYRQLILVTGYATGWEPKSIRTLLEDALRIYSNASNKKIMTSVSAPESISGYSNNYVIALLLPLLENAVEASPPETMISVDYFEEKDSILFHITNTLQKGQINEYIFESGYTTKINHQGLGLSTVRNLLANAEGSSITHKVEVNQVTFILQLRGREK